MMKTVFQIDENGCGIACLAMLAGITYGEAKSEIAGHFIPGWGVHTQPLLQALENHGLRLIRRGRLSQSFPVARLSKDALLYCKMLPTRGLIDPETNSHSHCVVWDAHQQVVRDPYRYKKPLWLTTYFELEASK
jgi:hypothetical protein